jgi:predicted NAD-dependent protein-ADP-ribosyltransferase YbiA (DUF1768 family)
VIAIGGDTISLELENGDALHVGTRTLSPEMGNRPFDLPITERGTLEPENYPVHYFIQPRAEKATDAQYQQFMRDVAQQGYWFSDPGERNVGYYRAEDRVALIDPWAVEKLPGTAETAAGNGMETAPDLAAKPLNVASMSDEEIGRDSSNFGDTPFTYRGKRYASFESFYQGLKESDLKERARIAKLPAKQAKAVGRKLHTTESTFDGVTFQLGSDAHHQILQDALLEKFLQNPDVARSFVETRPRPIVHELGRPENPATALPSEVFTRMLTEVREALAAMNLDNLGKRKK